jgi:hypothetical protein
VRVLCNMAECLPYSSLEALALQRGALRAVASALEALYDPTLLELCVDFVAGVLRAGGAAGPDSHALRTGVEEAGCVSRLQALERALPARLPLSVRVQKLIDFLAGDLDHVELGTLSKSPAPRLSGSSPARQPLAQFSPDFILS